ncbi:cytosine methyltransferase [Clostridium sp. W14A]|nr:cytosine methyltransferase [Clostridium sp. W14A]
MTLGSLFDGIGGFPLAGVRQGFTPIWASEIEPFPIEVTKLRFPQMLPVGDITLLKGADLAPVDVVCGGSPCQDLSVANGRRLGLQGERSGLFMAQIRIITEMRANDKANGRPVDAVRPRYMVWENVPGAFSCSGGEDFRAVLEETIRVADGTVSVPRPPGGVWQSAGAILGDQFSLAWRVYDAQYWSVPQRRKRIFLVADFSGHSASKILFEQDRLFGNPAAGEKARQGVADDTQAGAGDPGRNTGNSGKRVTPQDTHSKSSRPYFPIGEGYGHSSIAEEDEGQADGFPVAFACNQRDEVRTLNDVAGAIQAQPGMKQQTFVAQFPKESDENSHRPAFTAGVVAKGNGDCFITPEQHTSLTTGGGQAGQGYPCVLTAGFCAGAGPSAGGIGYQVECAPTLKASESGNMMPSILCLNDQGGNQMDVSKNIAATLRAQEHGHSPLVLGSQPELFENYGIDSRYTGPHKVAPTMSARYGTGGNNVPLISQPSLFPADSGEDSLPAETYCIAGNIIDRQVKNGGNGIGVQPDISYTVTATDRHCVFSQQRTDEYVPNKVVSTQSARQYKDATDLVCDIGIAEPDCRSGTENGILGGALRSNTGNGDFRTKLNPARVGKLIRRLTPLECERLQGFPDHWTDIPGASDSARYKALGNSVAIPCVEHVLRGIAYFLQKSKEEERLCTSIRTI